MSAAAAAVTELWVDTKKSVLPRRHDAWLLTSDSDAAAARGASLDGATGPITANAHWLLSDKSNSIHQNTC